MNVKPIIALLGLLQACGLALATEPRTRVSIVEEAFHINERPTYAGREWQGKKIEGLLLNSRMVQATFDDLNTQTRQRWAYADTGVWDADRNLREFLAAMPEWRRHGLLGITVNLQGGSPQGYSKEQPSNNFISAVSEYAGWGYFDYRIKDEGFDEGYQSVPVNWGISSDRKRGFFKLLSEITGDPQ